MRISRPLLVLVCVVVEAILAQPNDACSRSRPVPLARDGSRMERGTTRRATFPRDNNLICDSDGETLLASNQGVWYHVEGNGQMLSIHSCESRSNFPVQVYIWEEGPTVQRCDSARFQCVNESRYEGNCFSDPRQSCATIQTERSTFNQIWTYRVFATTNETGVTGDFSLTFSFASLTSVCQDTLAMDESCDADLNAQSDSSQIDWFYSEQDKCIADAIGNGNSTDIPPSNSIVDCRGSDSDFYEFKKECLSIENHEVCHAMTPRTRLDDEGNSVKFQLRRGDCIPSTCVTDYMRRVQIAFSGTNSCTTGGLSGGAIAGIVAGALAGCICCFGVVYYARKHQQEKYPGLFSSFSPGGGYNSIQGTGVPKGENSS